MPRPGNPGGVYILSVFVIVAKLSFLDGGVRKLFDIT